MKTMKKLIPALAMLLVSAVLLGTSTFAWFSMNRVVTASNMTIKATSQASLVISNAAPTGSTTTTDHDFVAAATALTPATHDSTYATYASGLKAIDAATQATVDPGTGLAPTYNYTNGVSGTNYLDFVVYISTAGATALTGQDLVATVSATTGGDTHLAGSVDFYVETLADSATASTFNASTFKGTLNLAGKDPVTNNGSATRTQYTILTDGTIPLNSADDSYLRVTMRVYFDGALLKSAGQCYVYSNVVTVTDLAITVTFTANAHV